MENLTISQTYFDFFYQNIHETFHPRQETATHTVQTLFKKVFTSLKLIPATLGLVIGSVLWIKEHSIDKIDSVYSIRRIARKHCIEPAQIIKIDRNTPITQTFITFPYLEISRLGDYAKFYLNAKWIARQLDVPLLIRPFPNSDQFHLSQKYKYHLDDSLKRDNFTRLSEEQAEKICRGELTKKDLGPGIFTVPYPWKWKPQKWSKDQGFMTDYRHDFMPARQADIPIVEPVKGKVNIAIQVRDGGTFDNLSDKFLYPLRFPDFSYYEAQLEYVLNLEEYKHQRVHLHIFTDAVNPDHLKAKFQSVAQRCGRSHEVSISYRPNDRSADEAILSDLISISQFPIVIRAKSGFSDLATFFGRPQLEIFPSRSQTTEEGVASVDQVKIVKRKTRKSFFHAEETEEVIVQEGMYSKKLPEEKLDEFRQNYDYYSKRKYGNHVPAFTTTDETI
jgi:hypothetical protein